MQQQAVSCTCALGGADSSVATSAHVPPFLCFASECGPHDHPNTRKGKKTHMSGAPARTRARFTLGRNSKRVEGMGGHHTDGHGNTRFNCGSAALGLQVLFFAFLCVLRGYLVLVLVRLSC